MYAEFDLHLPVDLTAALDILTASEGDDTTVPLAGGTNVIVDLRARTLTPGALVGLANVPGLRGIECVDGRVVIGAKTTLTDILRSPLLARCAPSMIASAKLFGGQMVRNTATVAGNICYGSPAADLVPPLLALDAEVKLESRAGTRTVPMSEFFLGYKQMDRRADELLTEVSFPEPSANTTNLFYKLARRKGDAITVVGIAVALAVDGDTIRHARIALGAVAPVVKRATAAERMLEGERLTPELIDLAARRAVEESNPIDDVRASAEYRRHAVHVLTRRLLTRACDRGSKGDRGS